MELVSIIMPCFNNEATIKESINSVLSQSYKYWELIIINDNSTDDSQNIINDYVNSDERIKLITNEKNIGAGGSRNKGIEIANGRFIAFLDADDVWLPEKLAKQIKFMRDGNYALTYSYYQKFDSTGLGAIVRSPATTTYRKLLYSNVIGCLTGMYDTDFLGKCYMPLIRKRQDMGLWLSILKKCNKVYCLPEVLAYYRIDSGMTKNKLDAAKYQWRFYRDVTKLNLIQSSWYFVWYSVLGLVKYKK